MYGADDGDDGANVVQIPRLVHLKHNTRPTAVLEPRWPVCTGTCRLCYQWLVVGVVAAVLPQLLSL